MLDLIFSVWVQSERGRRGFRGVPLAQDSNVFQRQAEARLEFGLHCSKMCKRIVWVSGINKTGTAISLVPAPDAYVKLFTMGREKLAKVHRIVHSNKGQHDCIFRERSCSPWSAVGRAPPKAQTISRAIARIWSGYANLLLGDRDAAIEQFQIGLRLSPLDPRIFMAQNGIANAHFLAGRYEEGCLWAKTAREITRHPVCQVSRTDYVRLSKGRDDGEEG
jgi:hypothetical protein